MARVMEDSGRAGGLEGVGVDATGQVFNSIVAIEQYKGHEMNPFVNPGAIATTGLVQGKTDEEKWSRILATLEDVRGPQARRERRRSTSPRPRRTSATTRSAR